MIENCGNCVFGVQDKDRICCHRHSPKVFYGVTGGYTVPVNSHGLGSLGEWRETKGQITAWPEVREKDFCGDFELKDAS